MPVENCEECRKWLIDEETGHKLRERKRGEEPPCENCARAFDWEPEALLGLKLANQCLDLQTLSLRQLPDTGGIRDQNPRLLMLIEVVRHHLGEKKKKEEDKVEKQIQDLAKKR